MNLSTAIVLIIVIIIVGLALRSIINYRKNGKSSCGGDCGGCGNQLCHQSTSLYEEYKKENIYK